MSASATMNPSNGTDPTPPPGTGLFHVYVVCDITGSMGNQLEGVKRMVATYCEKHYPEQATKIAMHIVTFTEDSHQGSFVTHFCPDTCRDDGTSVFGSAGVATKSDPGAMGKIKSYFGSRAESTGKNTGSAAATQKSAHVAPDPPAARNADHCKRLATRLAAYVRAITLCNPPGTQGIHCNGGDGPENLLHAMAVSAGELPAGESAVCFLITDADPHFRSKLSPEARQEKRALRALAYKKYDAFGILNRICREHNVILVPILYGHGQSPLGTYFYHQAASVSGGCLLRSKDTRNADALARGLAVMIKGIYGNLMKYKADNLAVQNQTITELLANSSLTAAASNNVDALDSGVFESLAQGDMDELDNAFHFTDASGMSIRLKREPGEDKVGRQIPAPPLETAKEHLPASAGLAGLFAECASVMNAINSSLQETNDEKYMKYACKTISWDDVKRFRESKTTVTKDWDPNAMDVDGGMMNTTVTTKSLGTMGPNVTDTRLRAKDGRRLYTVRCDNWNEKVGTVSASDIAVIVGNEAPGSTERKPVTLRDYLRDLPTKYGKLVSMPENSGGGSLENELLDKQVSVRFQTTFIPVEDEEKSAMEFTAEMYNYESATSGRPRNLVVLCTSQGTALQPPVGGTAAAVGQKLFHHVAENDVGSKFSRHWLEVERSSHKVGGEQKETKEEKEDALKRGKAISCVIGPRALGTRFNALMTLQIPIKGESSGTKDGNVMKANSRNSSEAERAVDYFERYEQELSGDDDSEPGEPPSAMMAGASCRMLGGMGPSGAPKTAAKLLKKERSAARRAASSSSRFGSSGPPGGFHSCSKKAGGRIASRLAAEPAALRDFSLGSCEILYESFDVEDCDDEFCDRSEARPMMAACAPPPPAMLRCKGSPPMGGAIASRTAATPSTASQQSTQKSVVDPALSKYRAARHKRAQGKANAARVSVGSKYMEVYSEKRASAKDASGWGGQDGTTALQRSDDEHITATIVLFYTVAGGVPTNVDVMKAIDDLEELYEKCGAQMLGSAVSGASETEVDGFEVLDMDSMSANDQGVDLSYMVGPAKASTMINGKVPTVQISANASIAQEPAAFPVDS